MMPRSKYLISTILVVVIFLSALPEVARYYVINKITQQGFDNVTIEDVDLNLFTGTLQIENVRVEVNNEEKLVIGLMRADYRWQGIFSGGIATELIEIQDTTLAVIEDDDGNFEVVIPIVANEQSPTGGQTQIEPEQTLAVPNLDVDLVRLANIDVNIQLKQFTGRYNIRQFTLTRVSTWHDYPAELTLDSRLNNTEISAKLTAQPLATTPSVQGDIDIKNIQYGDFQKLANIYLPYPIDTLQGMTDVELYLDGIRDKDNNLIFNFNGDLVSKKLHLSSKQLAVNLQNLSSNFDAKLQLLKDTTLVSGTLNSEIEDLTIVDEASDHLLIGFEHLTSTNLTITDELSVSVEQLGFSELSWFNSVVKQEQKQAQTQKSNNQAKVKSSNNLDTLIIDNAQLGNSFNRLTLDKIQLAGLQTSLQLNEQNELSWLQTINQVQARFFPTNQSLQTNQTEEINADTTITPTVEPVKINNKEDSNIEFVYGVSTVSLTSPAHINLIKTLKSQPHKIQLDIKKLALTELTNQLKPKESHFELHTTLNKHASISVEGSGYLTQSPIDLSLNGQIEDMSFVTLSPFIESFAGYQFTRGQFDHKFELQLHQNTIEMSNELQIRKLQVKDIDESKVVSTLPIPMAISVLEDNKGVIDIDIPVKGNLDDANVNVNSILQKSITQAVKKGSIGFLKYALQPYGAVFIAAEYLVDASNQIAFDDMTFTVNSAHLEVTQLDYANKLIAVLTKRDEIDLHLCGVSNKADKAELIIEYQGEQLDAQLAELAKQRAVSLKSYMSEQGITNKRLFLCKAKYQEDGTSGVTISMD
ncbi:DUF748 domain-containing protein [Thalassotalea nanhaiensis]|uniref:DUF748 domain-containing protein n=1 Tax=Thalassotalea nanhaiensis TaxID=3065648 RepID=A0ABY9TLM6_9GAMM|nr:DUF748 domain-containing protein [Colwelliaceae bacterium SQ345]